ncbi:hypothetical protein KIPB_004403 [Kipferlia bialata]|uniref:Uncharacterized protein n=1 Tax=Kipferlia bialata TaxID=797122 RepID=A0A391NL78_9EUKA|nr:hypothetical protein KIPB_004403 [Kipferlia bialata]|eukprot:g4403.t1
MDDDTPVTMSTTRLRLLQHIIPPVLLDEWDEWALGMTRVTPNSVCVLARARCAAYLSDERALYLYTVEDDGLSRESLSVPYDVCDGGAFANALTCTESHLAVTSPRMGAVHIMALDTRKWTEVPVPDVLRDAWRPDVHEILSSPLVSLFTIGGTVYAVSFYYRQCWSIDTSTMETVICEAPPLLLQRSQRTAWCPECVCNGLAHFFLSGTHLTFSPVTGWSEESVSLGKASDTWAVSLGKWGDSPVIVSPVESGLHMLDEVTGETGLVGIEGVPWDLDAPAGVAPACGLGYRSLVTLSDPTYMDVCDFDGPVWTMLYQSLPHMRA